MTPLAWLVGFVLPACAAAGAGGLPTPQLMDMRHIQRPASPNTALAAPAGSEPAPDVVTPVFPVPASRLYAGLITMAAGQPRTFLAAEYPAQRQAHFVARSAVFNFPDLIAAQVSEAGADQQHAGAVFTQRVRLFGPRREPPAPGRLACRSAGHASTTLTRDSCFMPKLRPFLRDVWHLSRPYYRSEEKWSAWGLLVSIMSLRLLLVGMTVILSFWNREFFNSLQDKDFAAFFGLLFVYRRTPSGFMPGFCEIAAVYILVAVYYTYLSQWLQIRWRRWLTVRFLDEWLADRAYYRISLTADRAAIGTDNPDQRIAEDIRDFVDNTLTLGISLLANVVTLFSFLGILWSLSGTITLFGISIPGYMVWVALVYAVVGTWLTHLVGRPLAALRFRQQRVEADFRYSLVRVRENMEGIALYNGEAEEKELTWPSLPWRDRQLVGDHAAHQDAERAHRRL